MPHLRRGALEQATAAHGKHGVAAEQGIGIGEPIGDMPPRMAGHKEDLRVGFAQPVGVAVVNLDIDAGDARAVCLGSHDRAAGRCLDLHIAAGVIAMVMGVQDVGDRPALGFGCVQYRSGHRRIDHGGVAGHRAVGQIDIIVAQNGDLVDFQAAHGVLLGRLS